MTVLFVFNEPQTPKHYAKGLFKGIALSVKGLEFAKYSVKQFTQTNALILMEHLST